MSTMNIISQFDDLIACYDTVLRGSNTNDELLQYVQSHELFFSQQKELEGECKQLKSALDKANHEISILERKINNARNILDSERRQKKKVESERNAFINLFDEIRNYFLYDPRLNLPEEAKRKLSSISQSIENLNLDNYSSQDKLNTLYEVNSTGSNLSDISISHVENDDSMLGQPRDKKKHFCAEEEFVTVKRRKSSSLAFSPTAPRAESIESLESEIPVEYEDEINENHNPVLDKLNTKVHCFISKQITISELCMPCNKRVGFQHRALKCIGCKAIVHAECRERLPLPCLRMRTPHKSSGIGTLSDYAPLEPPMIPAIIIHCVNEIEKRGLIEEGIYRISGTESEVRALKEKFLKCKGVPNLADVDLHVICNCVKSFLRNLQDSVIPQVKRPQFVQAMKQNNKEITFRVLISKLPQVNRETLAYLVLHLKLVANSPACKMSISNLAKMFGPAIIGFSGEDVASTKSDIEICNAIMEELLMLPHHIWNNFLTENISEMSRTPVRTFSVESVCKKTGKGKYTPRGKLFFGTSAKKD